MLIVKIGKHTGFCLNRRSYLACMVPRNSERYILLCRQGFATAGKLVTDHQLVALMANPRSLWYGRRRIVWMGGLSHVNQQSRPRLFPLTKLAVSHQAPIVISYQACMYQSPSYELCLTKLSRMIPLFTRMRSMADFSLDGAILFWRTAAMASAAEHA